MARTASSQRIVVLLLENKTPDFSFRSLAAFGADIAQYPASAGADVAPDYDQPHDRNAWVHYSDGRLPGGATPSSTTMRVIPYHSWLAKYVHVLRPPLRDRLELDVRASACASAGRRRR